MIEAESSSTEAPEKEDPVSLWDYHKITANTLYLQAFVI